jgi:putative ABC transport system permease protein
VRFGDLFQLSLENLWRTRLRSSLTTLGVVIGIGVLVSMVSFGTGIQKNVTEGFRESDLFTSMEVLPTEIDLEDVMSGNIEIPEGEIRPLGDEAVEAIRAIPGVEVAFPEVRFPVRIEFGEREARTHLRAIPSLMADYRPFTDLPHGRFFENDDEPSIILSQRFLRNVGIVVAEGLEGSGGDGGAAEGGEASAGEGEDEDELVAVPVDSILGREVEVVTSVLDASGLLQALTQGMSRATDMPLREETVTLTVIGIQPQLTGFGGSRFLGGVLVPTGTAEGIPRLGFTSIWEALGPSDDAGGYPSVYVRVKTMRDLETVREAVEEMGYGVVAIADQLEEFKRNFLIMDALLGAVGTVALIIASLGIINTMVTSILERTREIGIMKAIGGSEGDIRKIFFVEAATIGVLGGVFGLVLGWVVTRIANVFANHYLRPEGFAAVDFFFIPLWLIMGAIAFAVAVSLLAGVYPAVRAARVDPVQALRHD